MLALPKRKKLFEREQAKGLKYFFHPSFAMPDHGGILSEVYVPDDIVLNKRQEFILFQQMNYCKHRCSTATNKKETKAWMLQTMLVRNKIINHNLRLVRRLARLLAPRIGARPAELLGEVCESLIIAIEKFDFTLGYKFSTYASNVVHRRFKRAHSGIREVVSGELESVPDTREDETARTERKEQAKENVERLLKCLDARKRRVIRATSGLDGEACTHVEMGRKMNITDERVRQLKNRGLEQLREKAKSLCRGKSCIGVFRVGNAKLLS